MINYENGKIYKICSKTMDGDIYIGSTTKRLLSQRMSAHIYDYNKFKDAKCERRIRSFDIFEKYGVENCCIVLLEAVCAKDKNELHAREAYYIKTLSCVNKQIPTRTDKEYRVDNKEIIKEKWKHYAENNKEKLKNSKAEKITCECGCQIRKDKLQRHKETKKHSELMSNN